MICHFKGKKMKTFRITDVLTGWHVCTVERHNAKSAESYARHVDHQSYRHNELLVEELVGFENKKPIWQTVKN